MKIYVMRHGETEQNVKKVVQGITDSELTEDGIKQIEKMRGIISEKKITRIISSPLKRAYRTAEIISNGLLPINKDDRLIERDWGLMEQVPICQVDRIRCWNYYLNIKENSIEPIQDFMERIREFLWEIKMKYQDENILIVSHSAVSRAIYYYINGIPEDGDMTKVEISNLEIKEYQI